MSLASSSLLFTSLFSAAVETSTLSGTVLRQAADSEVTCHQHGPHAYSIFVAVMHRVAADSIVE